MHGDNLFSHFPLLLKYNHHILSFLNMHLPIRFLSSVYLKYLILFLHVEFQYMFF